MSFYSSIAEYYDFIFPFNRAHVDFVKSCIEQPYEGKMVLDVGCGTGDLAVELTGMGFRVTGIDYDQEMLAEAKKKDQGSIPFLHMDMRDLSKAFKPATFDVVLCFGNTLVHLSDVAETGAFCGGVREALKGNGKFLLQILNYDHILDHGVWELPLIENDTVRFERSYMYDGAANLLAFETKLYVKATGSMIENTIPLYPIRKGELKAALGKAGFAGISFYAGFDKSPLKDDSLPLVVEAQAT
ncbi:MAG TPA: class I SAM-dependent methyltransferase [Dissulfurispiraceae bacterium]|nr:class I SAM-dependent methyltransferase [Dissulfurispiraceae bacterium]